MKKLTIILLSLLLSASLAYAQNTEPSKEELEKAKILLRDITNEGNISQVNPECAAVIRDIKAVYFNEVGDKYSVEAS